MAGSHKRETNARFAPKAALVAAPVALLATTSVVTLGVTQAETAGITLEAAPQEQANLVSLATVASLREATANRAPVVSRSAVRVAQKERKRAATEKADQKAQAAEAAATSDAVAAADKKQWTTTELNLWSDTDGDATQVGTLENGVKVLVTGRTREGRDEVVIKGVSRWVTAGYLSNDEPLTGVGGVCTNGTTIASWVDSNLKNIHQAVCARFPSIQTYGTRTGAGDHGRGKAVDIMLSGPIGWEVANYLRENYAAFGISYLIYEQKIWSVERSGEGWRGMANRGGATANHMDHVHVSIY